MSIVHCLKTFFFDDLVDKIYGAHGTPTEETPFDMNYFRKRLQDACADDVCLLQCALWVKEYLEKKIAYLEEYPTEKVGIGQSTLHHNHIYIIQKLLEFINNVITEEQLSATVQAEAVVSGNSRFKPKMILKF